MRNIVFIVYKVIKVLHLRLMGWFWSIVVRGTFFLNGVICRRVKALGPVRVNVSRGGHAEFGDFFYVRSGIDYTEVGSGKSRILVGPGGRLVVGNHLGMSNTTIVCDMEVIIGDHVLLGGGVQIFDTNFHSTESKERCGGKETRGMVRKSPVYIGNNVFVGTNSIICKGVTIGENSIVAAGSVVVCDIPPNQIWGGNPAKKIREGTK